VKKVHYVLLNDEIVGNKGLITYVVLFKRYGFIALQMGTNQKYDPDILKCGGGGEGSKILKNSQKVHN